MNLRTEPNVAKHAEATDHNEISPFCPRFQYTLELIGRRWVGAILRTLMGAPRRFNEILGAIPGLSDRLLTERLRELETEGIVIRVVHSDRPVRVTYDLTCCGRSLEPVIRSVSEWAEVWVR
ncbi:MAG: helix-turn-helix domain-containing protein [Vulcanimicrobiaceae bacterium]|jgi:DNA-binding HxlR family transcriptional regulator